MTKPKYDLSLSATSNATERQIYYGNDLFKFEANYKKGQLLERSNLTKKLYETFESLALTL